MRPNILFIQVDQLAAQYLRSYGDPHGHAPILDEAYVSQAEPMKFAA